MVTIEPPVPRAAISRAAACTAMNVPVRFTARIRCQSSSDSSRAGEDVVVPAEQTSPSIRSCAVTVVSMNATTLAGSATSSRCPSAFAPIARTSSTTDTSAPLVQIAQHEAGAFGGCESGRRAPDAARRAGDGDDLVVQLVHAAPFGQSGSGPEASSSR